MNGFVRMGGDVSSILKESCCAPQSAVDSAANVITMECMGIFLVCSVRTWRCIVC